MSPWIVIPPILIAIVLIAWQHQWLLVRLRQGRVYALAMWYVLPHLRFSLCHTSMTHKKFMAGHEVIKRGDFVVTRDGHAPATWFVPGIFTHALLCIGEENGVMMCTDLTHTGRGKRTLAEACFHSSRFSIGRGTTCDDEYVDKMIAKSDTFEDVAYDTQYLLGPKRVYCSEYIWLCDTEGRLGIVPSKAWGTGQKVITSDDLVKAKRVEVIYDSDQCAA